MNEVQNIEKQNGVQTVKQGSVVAGFDNLASFNLLMRMADFFSKSSLVPESFRGERNVGNCAIALNMAQRLGADPLMTMQNLYVVYGTPAWSSKFMIAMFNQCGRFTSIKYKETGKKGTDSQGVIAYAAEKETGEIIEGPEVTIAVAKAEGWYGKNGSKWKTMPDQMLRYRAAAWFIRTTAPELSMGLQTADELEDIREEKNITPKKEPVMLDEAVAEKAAAVEAAKREPVTIGMPKVNTAPQPEPVPAQRKPAAKAVPAPMPEEPAF